MNSTVAAFVGSAPRGPVDIPRRARGAAEFEREFGGPGTQSPLGLAVRQFFQNGGREAIVVRVASPDGDAARPITDDLLSGPALREQRRGLWALDKADAFNLLCVPPFGLDGNGDIGAQTRRAAADYCLTRRAMFIVDPLAAWSSVDAVFARASGLESSVWGLPASTNAALYFPAIRVADALRPGQTLNCAPCGAVAGVYARTDAARGVWKAPAGQDAGLAGATGVALPLADTHIERLNPKGVNCLRIVPAQGVVVWGARTLMGDDALASEWKYVPVRRLALYVESSLTAVIADTVAAAGDAIENGEPLWAMLRQQTGAFLHELFRAGALAGATPREAYFLKCDRTTMTQDDIDQGRLVVEVGIAPLKPAEFVIVRIGQWRMKP
jgi:hypothetical protein